MSKGRPILDTSKGAPLIAGRAGMVRVRFLEDEWLAGGLALAGSEARLPPRLAQDLISRHKAALLGDPT